MWHEVLEFKIIHVCQIHVNRKQCDQLHLKITHFTDAEKYLIVILPNIDGMSLQ